jgi:HD superfamily phosphohydrolase
MLTRQLSTNLVTIQPMNLKQISMLTTNFNHVVRDPLWKDIYLSQPFKNLYTSPPIQKLHNIKQLGPTYLLYPGAVHTRNNHSLGVFHLSRLIILTLLHEGISLKIENINAFLAASLLHDLGHFPYTHALKDVVKQTHEKLGAKIIKNDPYIKGIIENQLNSSIDSVIEILDYQIPTFDKEILFFRSILSGVLDPDKLDYLNRDAFYCGVPYGMQDAPYIIRNFTFTDDLQFALKAEATTSIQHLLFSKYLMYKNVYWHPVTRSATAMIKKGVLLALKEGLFKEEDLYDLDDYSFSELFRPIKGTFSEKLFSSVKQSNLLLQKGTTPVKEEKIYTHQEKEKLEEIIFKEIKKSFPELQKWEVVLDIPEKVSFEANIPIVYENGKVEDFNLSDTLFSGNVEKSFSSSLQKVSLFLPKEVNQNLSHSILTEIFK